MTFEPFFFTSGEEVRNSGSPSKNMPLSDCQYGIVDILG